MNGVHAGSLICNGPEAAKRPGSNSRAIAALYGQSRPNPSKARFATFWPNLIEPHILAGAPAGGVVLDPFMRTGATAYAAETVRASNNAFSRYPGLPAADLDRASIVKTLDAIVRKGSAVMATQTAAYGKAAYGWAVKCGALLVNPFTSLPVAPTVKRERVLSGAELAAILRAADGVGPFNAIVQFLILTGQRREEVAGMKWTEMSDDCSTWTIPAGRTKSGATQIVPLSEPPRELLHSLPQFSELVFPGLRGAFRGWSRAKSGLDAKSGVTHWRLHDLRRAMATGLQRLGVRLEVTEQVLNYILGSCAGIAGVCQRHGFVLEKRAVLQAWGEHVIAIVEGRAVANSAVALPQRA